MAVATRKQEPQPTPKIFHATVLVTRAEEWCVEAETLEQARELLAHGCGHRFNLGSAYTQKFRNLAGEIPRGEVFRERFLGTIKRVFELKGQLGTPYLPSASETPLVPPRSQRGFVLEIAARLLALRAHINDPGPS